MTQPLDTLDVASLGTDGQDTRAQGRYEVLHEIDSSGSHQIYEVRDESLGRNVVLKCLQPHLIEREGAVEAFFEHMRIMAVLHHPGIPAVFEFGRLAPDGRPFGTMNHVHGTKLSTLLAQRSSPADELMRFLDIFERVSQAMAFVHARNIVHRSLSPAHIFVSDHGDVQIMDWSFAQSLSHAASSPAQSAPEGASVLSVFETVRSGRSGDQDAEHTMLAGAYMSPEQAMGFEARMDERSDVFSLGAILCEILTGQPPYSADTGNLIILASRCELDEVFAKLDASPAHAELNELTKQCLSREEQRRPHDAGVVSERVTAWLYSRGGQGSPTSNQGISGGSIRLQRNVLAAICLVLLVALIWKLVAS